MKLIVFVLGCCLFTGSSAFADVIQPDSEPESKFFAQPQDKNPIVHQDHMPQRSDHGTHSLNMSIQQLQHHPQLLSRAMQAAITSLNIEAVATLLPSYRQSPQHSEVVIHYAQGLLYHYRDQDYTAAIDAYQRVLTQESLPSVQLLLSQALLYSGRKKSAQQQLDQLSAQDLPVHMNAMLDALNGQLQQSSRWHLDGGVNYVYDKNINNAPVERIFRTENGGVFTFPEPQSAGGLHYLSHAHKDTVLADNWSHRLSLQLEGKYYPDQKDYNDTLAEVGSGLLLQQSKWQVSVLPFVQKRWFGNQTYADMYGVRLDGQYQLKPQWQLFSGLSLTKNQYQQRQHLDGQTQLLHGGVAYSQHPSQYWVVSVNHQNQKTQDLSDAYVASGVRIGFGKDFAQDWRTYLSVSHQYKHYDQPDLFNIVRKSRQNQYYVSVANKRLSWAGFMPKLVLSHTVDDGNHPLYRAKQTRVALQVSKVF